MDWNVGTINKMQTHGSYIMPRVTSAASVTSQTNVLMQNFCNSGNSQTTNIRSNVKYMLTNKQQCQNNRASKTLRPVFPKVAVSKTSFGLNNNFYSLSPPSLSTVTVQMAADIQNPNSSRNMHISSSVPVQGSTVNSVQNMHQKTNAYIAVGSFSNQTLQNCSNSMGTSVYQQDLLNTSSPKRALTQMPYYYMNVPTSQVGARVSLNSASNYYLPPQQNVQYPDYSSAKKCPNSAIPVTMQSQPYASYQINPPPYPIYSHYDYGNAVQATNISLSDSIVPRQGNHGQFVLQQPTAILSNEKVESYHNSLTDQNSNLYSVRPDQKSQSLSFCTETNVVSPTADNISGLKTTMQLSNESVKSYVEGNFSNSIPTITTTKAAEPLQQTNKTLQLEKNVSNENLSKDKLKITRENLSLDVQALYEMRNALLKLKDNFSLKQKLYLSSLQSGQTSNTSINNQNPNNLFPHDTNPSVKCTVQQILSDKVNPNQFSSNSHNSSVVPQKTKYHLLPILWNMLKGTDDENMLFSADVESGDKYQNKHFIVQENSCTDSNGDTFGNPVNTDGTTKLSYKNSPVHSSQGTNIIKSAHNQLEKISAVPNGDLFNSSEQNKDSERGGVQYLNDGIQSLIQNPDVSQESSSMKKSIKEEHGNSTSACHIQHSETTCLQKPTNSEKMADMSNFSISKGVEAITGTHGVERTCSLEELKTSLALWRKCLPKSLNELINGNNEPSSNGIDGKGTAKTLENLPNILTQNYDTKITVERTQIYGSFEKNLDGVNSNLPKSSELQVAVVTPRILSKNNDVQKNNESIYPAIDIEKGTVHTLEKAISTKSDSNKEKRTIYSPTRSYKYCDLNEHQGTNKPTGNNKIVKEVGTNHSFDLNQEKTNSSLLGLKQYALNSGDQCELITNDLIASPLTCVTSKKHGPNLDESNNTADIGLKDSMLQIASVCTLVQGDAFYNSQIADIFSASLSKPDIKFEISEERMPSLQYNEDKSGLLKNDPEVGEEDGILLPSGSFSKALSGNLEDLQTLESPQCDKTSVETNASNSEKQKDDDFLEVASLSGKKNEQDISYGCNMDLSNNEVFENQDSLCETNNMSSIRKAGDSEHALDKGKEAHLGSSTESSVMFLNNQLTELSKEFPYGIGYLNMVKEIENKDSITILTERKDKENTIRHEKSLDPSDAVDQIKIVILNSQQMSEVFPECSQQSSNKLVNHGGDQMRMDSKHNFSKDKGHYRKSNQDLNVDSKTVRSERLAKTERTYCCLPGWLASKYNVEPCSCMLAKEPGLKGKTDSQSKERSKSNESDCSLKNEVHNSILDTGNNIFLLGDQSNKALTKTFGCKETEPQIKEDKLPKLEQTITPCYLLEKSNSQEPKKQGKKLSHSMDSQSLQRERAGTNNMHNKKNSRRNISKSEAQYHLNTDFKKIIIKKFAKKKLEKKSFNKILKSKTDIDHHRGIETKLSANFEKYKIKRDTSETHMIKGPVSSRSLKRKMKEKKLKALETQPSEVMPSSTLNSVSFASEKHENVEHNSTLGSQEHLNKTKLKDLEKQYGYKKVQYNEPICPKQPVEKNITQLVKRINLERYAYRKDKTNAWKCQSSHFNNRIPAFQNEGDNPSNVFEIHSPVKKSTLDSSNPDKWSVKSLSDKKCFKRKNKHTVFLQKEQKKNYLNRVAFKRTAQKTIRLTSLDSVHPKPLWQVKSSNGTEGSEPHQKGSSSSYMSEVERPQMLEFKMCPEILFRKSTSEEQTLDSKLPEKNRISVTAVKSKREDWLNYCPVKRRKLEENESQVNNDIPLDTAIKILEGNEVFQGSTKDSKATFDTYRKMHLEKRSQSLDSGPIS